MEKTYDQNVADFKYDLFVSYAHKDDEDEFVSKQIVQRLRNDFHFTIFFDKDNLKGMDNWHLRLPEGLVFSRMLLAILSPHYFESEYCRKEFDWWLNHEVHRYVLGDGTAPIIIANVTDDVVLSPASQAWRKKILDGYQKCGYQKWDIKDVRSKNMTQCELNIITKILFELKISVTDRLNRLVLSKINKEKSNIPRHNARFSGRRESLLELQEMLKKQSVGAITTLQGIGGVGKSVLAFTYAHAFAWDYPAGMFYVSCEGMASPVEAINALPIEEYYRDIVFTDKEKNDSVAKARRLLFILRNNGKALIILDNVTQSKFFDPQTWNILLPNEFLPDLHFIITTWLDPNLYPNFRDQTLRLGLLNTEESMDILNNYRPFGSGPAMKDLLLKEKGIIDGRKENELSKAEKEELTNLRIRMQGLCSNEETAAREIAEILCGFTLAVEIVGTYLYAQDTICYTDYRDGLKKLGIKRLDETADRSNIKLHWHKRENLSALLASTFNSLSKDEMAVLRYAALMPPDTVPLPWLRYWAGQMFPELLKEASGGMPCRWSEVYNRLIGLQLLSSESLKSGQFPKLGRIHRLIAEAVPFDCDSDFQEDFFKKIAVYITCRVSALKEGFWHSKENHWELLPISYFVHKELDKGNLDILDAARSFAEMELHRGHSIESKNILSKVSTIERKSLRYNDDSQLAITNYLLAKAEIDLCNLSQAWRLLSESVTIGKKTLGQNSSQLNNIYLKLADIEYALGHFRKAQMLYRWHVLGSSGFNKSSIEQFNCSDFELVASCFKLAEVEQSLGEHRYARRLCVRAIELQGKLLDHTDHRRVTGNISLASIEIDAGNYLESEKLLNQTIKTQETDLGLENPLLATSYFYLARVEQMLGKFEQAKSHVLQAKQIHKTYYRQKDYRNAMRNRLLAKIEQSLGNRRKAKLIMLHVINFDKKVFGWDYPRLAEDYAILANIEFDLGYYEEAKKYWDRSLEVQNEHFGQDHPFYAIAYACLARIEQKSGDVWEARRLIMRAMEMLEFNLNDKSIIYMQIKTWYCDIERMLKNFYPFDDDHICLQLFTVLESLKRHIGPSSYLAAEVYVVLFEIERDLGNTKKAMLHLNEAIKIGKTVYHESHFKRIEWNKLQKIESSHGTMSATGEGRGNGELCGEGQG